MKTNELRNLDTAALNNKINDLKEELFNLRFQSATGQLENTARIGKLKKEIARIKTIIHERELNTEIK